MYIFRFPTVSENVPKWALDPNGPMEPNGSVPKLASGPNMDPSGLKWVGIQWVPRSGSPGPVGSPGPGPWVRVPGSGSLGLGPQARVPGSRVWSSWGPFIRQILVHMYQHGPIWAIQINIDSNIVEYIYIYIYICISITLFSKNTYLLKSSNVHTNTFHASNPAILQSN